MVDAVVVVAVQVVVEVASEAGEADVEVAGERGAPALFEDRAVQALDVAVGLRTAGANEGVAGRQFGQGGGEGRAAELVAVVRENALEPPAGGGEVLGDAPGEAAGLLGARVAGRAATSSAQPKLE